MPAGRPLAVESPQEFTECADAYFAQCVADEVRPTVNGLALALGLNSRQSLLNYENRPEFMDAVKRARTRLEVAWESALAGGQAAGTIFWLKNQGWKDTVEQAHTGEVVHRVERVIVRP